MQSFAVDGLRNLAARLAPKVARLVVSTTGGQESKEPCVFLAQWLYASAVECAWYIREDGDARTFDALNDILQGLHCISQRWDVGGTFIAPGALVVALY